MGVRGLITGPRISVLTYILYRLPWLKRGTCVCCVLCVCDLCPSECGYVWLGAGDCDTTHCCPFSTVPSFHSFRRTSLSTESLLLG